MITPADSAPQPPGQMAASAWDIQAPYEAGSPEPIAGGRDDVAGTADGAVAAAMGRQSALAAQTHQQGSVIGDLVAMPPSPLDPAASSPGTTDPAGSFYDPPRNYGG